jgi:DNA repair exonuclease SbcCD nuclease subunit
VSLFLLFSDPHLSDRAPSSCQDSYTDDIFDLLHQTVKVARQRKVAVAVCAGDFFHIKAPSRTSHELVNRAIDLIHAYPCPVFIVPGNHDIRFDKLDSIDSQPLGTLFRRGAWRLQGWASGHDAPRWLYGVPWQQEWTEESVSLALGDYRSVEATRTRPTLVVAHAPLYPPGRENPHEHFPADQWAAAMGGGGNVFYGHVHEPHDLYRLRDVVFCNNGALSRGSLHEYNLTRQVGCTLWDSETGAFEFVPLDAKPASEVFRLTEKQQVTDMQGRLDDFLEEIGGTSLESVSVESVIAHIKTLGLGRDAEDLAAELLTEASHGR